MIKAIHIHSQTLHHELKISIFEKLMTCGYIRDPFLLCFIWHSWTDQILQIYISLVLDADRGETDGRINVNVLAKKKC